MFVDSSAWLALVNADDTEHQRIVGAFRTLLDGRTHLFTTILVVAETHRLILHRSGIPAAAGFLLRLGHATRLTLVFPDEAHDNRARAWLSRLSDQCITYADAVSFAVMESSRCDLALTLDRDFVIAGFTPWA